MKTYVAYQAARPIADRVALADRFLTRFRGLMLRRALAPGEGLLLKNCSAIHCCFMRFPIDAVYLECNYLILMAFNAYDVPYRTKDDIDMEDCSEEMFSYLICSICPVKKTKPGL